jgi:hypothetical protein
MATVELPITRRGEWAGLSAPSAFAIDMRILMAARQTGYSRITRRHVVDVDEKQLPEALFVQKPDYATIRALLLDGHEIPGAELTTDVVYVLAKPATKETEL